MAMSSSDVDNYCDSRIVCRVSCCATLDHLLIVAFYLVCSSALQSLLTAETPQREQASKTSTSFRARPLEAGDQISIWAFGADEIPAKPVRIDSSGAIDLPLIGLVQAAGLTSEQLKTKLKQALKPYVLEPDVTVSLAEAGSQPVSVIGAVNNPGVHQMRENRTLIEVLSLAGGFRPEAGYNITLTRREEYGAIPLPNAKEDSGGHFSTAEVSTRDVMNSTGPASNLRIYPDDVIAVSRAQMVYIIGQVRKAGGFPLNEREAVSVLHALSLAEGLDRTAAPKDARILRRSPGVADRQEIPVNINKILAGESADVLMQPEDILFVPNNVAKQVSLRALEAAIQMGTGLVIWHR